MTNPLKLFPTQDETIEGTGSALREGFRKCADVLESCLAKIDEWEPKVHAWVIVDRDGAREQARERDEELAAGKDRGPLHGIPIGIKDIIDVAGLPTACGARDWAKGPAEKDAPLVAALREAGAVILGKTVTTPYAWVDPPVTRNPWNLDHTPGGSSSGSAAAVACGMCLGAIGSQTGGSITRPASFCGIAGYKPSYQEIATEGILPFAPSLDHPGPLARTVKDLYQLRKPLAKLAELRRVSPGGAGDFLSRTFVGYVQSRYFWRGGREQPRNPSALPLRIACLGGSFRDMAEPAMRDAIEGAVSAFIMNGAEVTKARLPATLDEVIAIHRVLMASEAAAFHRDRRLAVPEDYPPRISALLDEGLALTATQYVRARQRRDELAHDVARLFDEADILVTPAALGPAPDPDTTGNPAFNSPWSLWGLPTITFPVGLSPEGLPLGIQLIGIQEPFEGFFAAFEGFFAAASWCEDVIRRAHESRSD